MSLFYAVTIPCPQCRTGVAFSCAASLNAVARPDLRDAVLDGTYQTETCPACGTGFRCDPELSYMDTARGQWIMATAPEHEELWQDFEAGARSIFEENFGPTAPATARRIGAGLAVRVVFGWPALREKLLARDNDLDDAVLEAVKVALLRQGETAAMTDDNALRLIGMETDRLVLAWFAPNDDSPAEELRVPRGLYDAIADNRQDWGDVLAAVSSGPFVDCHRLLVEAAAD